MIFMDIDIFIDKIEFNIFKLQDQNKIDIIKDKIIIPKSFDIGNKLNYLRKFIVTLVNQHSIKKSHINIDDSIGIDIINIVKIEAVIEELLSNCGVKICK